MYESVGDLQQIQVSPSIGWSQRDLDCLFILLDFLVVCHGTNINLKKNKQENIESFMILGKEDHTRWHSQQCNVLMLGLLKLV